METTMSNAPDLTHLMFNETLFMEALYHAKLWLEVSLEEDDGEEEIKSNIEGIALRRDPEITWRLAEWARHHSNLLSYEHIPDNWKLPPTPEGEEPYPLLAAAYLFHALTAATEEVVGDFLAEHHSRLFNNFVEIYLPGVIEAYEKDGERDEIARAEEWSAFIDGETEFSTYMLDRLEGFPEGYDYEAHHPHK